MIKSEEIIEVGKFFKAHGLKGEMNVTVDYDPEILEEGLPLIVDIDGIFVPFYAESVRPKGSQSSLVKLKGVNTKEETVPFVNSIIYMRRRDVADFLGVDIAELEYDEDFIGYTLEDTLLGKIGVIEKMDYSTENILMTITATDNIDEEDELMIPFRDNFIVSIDDEGRTLIVDLPESIREIIKES